MYTNNLHRKKIFLIFFNYLSEPGTAGKDTGRSSQGDGPGHTVSVLWIINGLLYLLCTPVT